MMAVGMFAVLVMGVVANTKGRKIAVFISHFLTAFFILCVALSPNYWLTLVFYSLLGFAFPALSNSLLMI
jgi:MFS family permease